MNELFEYYSKYRGVKPLFNTVKIFDWYDGATCGIGILNNLKDYYLFNLVAWNIELDLKIFTILKLNNEWFEKLSEAKSDNVILEMLNKFYRQYNDDVYLLKSKSIEETNYNMIKSKYNRLDQPDTTESIADQNNEDRNKWFELFA